jgi:peroxiredoxin
MQAFTSLFGITTIILAMGAHADVPTDPTQVRPLPVGAQAPLFAGTGTDGKLRSFSPQGYQRPTIVIFYRGGWCPYCNMQLSDLRLAEPKLREEGFEIVFLSTDRPEILYSSLKAEDIHYTLLSDSRLEAAKAFHIAYKLDNATLAMQKKYGVDLDKTTGTALHELPVPSVFIIDTKGTIRYVYSNPDYTIRLGAAALMAAAKPYSMAKSVD